VVAVGVVQVGVGAAVGTINRVVGVVVIVDCVDVGGVAGAVMVMVTGEDWGFGWESGMITVGGVSVGVAAINRVVGIIIIVIISVIAIEGVAVAVEVS